MRVLIDTNVLISAALNPKGVPFQAYIKATSFPNHGLICNQNIDEMRRIFDKKFPDKRIALDKFLSAALLVLELIPTPLQPSIVESKIRDEKDRPILRAAIKGKADILLTGDKDFLESTLKTPIFMTPAQFLEY